ncbi:MAG TPA: hypothetical protein VMF52_03225 [Steroidobacteraceae bacterium]|nr:hypothetical protein [Steroidobacteraceae bacterium]
MKRIACLALVLGALVSLPGAAAPAAPTPSDLERSVFLSMLLDPDYAKSRLGARILGQQFQQDDFVCDHIAEKLLKEPAVPANGTVLDAIQWYIVTIRESCSGRYHDVLTQSRRRFTHEKLLKHIDAALAVPVDTSVTQYKEGGVDLLSRQIDLMQELGALRQSSASARGMAPGSTFGEVLERAGYPQDLTQLNYRVARYGRSNALVAHYRNGGMLIFRRDYARRHWVLGETLDELAPVSETYKGKDFGIAQSVACLRGTMFRGYIKGQGRRIRADNGLLWSLANRLTRVPFPSDKFEEDGMLVGVKLITTSRDPEALTMLRQIGAAPGDDIPEEARAYARKLERNQGVPAAEPDEPEDADADKPDDDKPGEKGGKPVAK